VVPTALSPAHHAAELNKLVNAWPDLPPVAKAGILAMVDAAIGTREGADA
jgi:hypothetical protein